MNMSWFFSFTFLLLIHKVSVQRDPVEGVIGKSVVLPCSIEQNPQTVFWRYRDSTVVCNIIGGKAIFSEQDKAYKNRVEYLPSENKMGDFSITLNNVKVTDTGTYTCRAPNHDPVKLQLFVKEKEENQTTTDKKESRTTQVSTGSRNGDSRRRADGLLTFLLGCALLYSLVF